MSRRTSLPGAEELFRTTSGQLTPPDPAQPAHAAPLRAVSGPAASVGPAERRQTDAPGSEEPSDLVETRATGVRHTSAARRAGGSGERRPSGRERHAEKITVYVSPEELLELEQARLTLRGEHGMVVDRGRIVREALAVVLADLDANGAESVLVRRLGGR